MKNDEQGLIAPAQVDGFTHESPIRAFSDWNVTGTWAIGKGFRPSLHHLPAYLDAMQRKEGWHLIQILDGGTLAPTLIFQRDRIMSFTVPTGSDAIVLPPASIEPWMTRKSDDPIPYERIPSFLSFAAEWLQVEEPTLVLEYSRTPAEEHDNPLSTAARLARCPILHGKTSLLLKRVIDGYREEAAKHTLALQPAVTSAALAVYIDDPINPKHYDGDICARLMAYMPSSLATAFKYCWRFGKKDALMQEINKALWYIEFQRGVELIPTPEHLQAEFACLAKSNIGRAFFHPIVVQAMFWMIEYSCRVDTNYIGNSTSLDNARDCLNRFKALSPADQETWTGKGKAHQTGRAHMHDLDCGRGLAI